MAYMLQSFSNMGDLAEAPGSQILALASPNRGYCGHFGSEAEDKTSLLLLSSSL